MKLYYLYILECSNGAYYTGYTTDIERRYQEHKIGSSKCKYTRSFPPKCIAACFSLTTELSDILKLEKSIKQLSKHNKTMLVEEPTRICELLNITDKPNSEIKFYETSM